MKLEDGLRLELPRDTLIEAEVVTELRGEVKVESSKSEPVIMP